MIGKYSAYVKMNPYDNDCWYEAGWLLKIGRVISLNLTKKGLRLISNKRSDLEFSINHLNRYI